jgi:sirohydrochlorin cobaltochelatase
MPEAFPNGSKPTARGLLLVGHGTRDAAGLAEFACLARNVVELLPEFAVEPCFLELAEPDIPTAVNRLLDRGIGQVTVAPLLLFAAGHAKRDIPAAVTAAIEARSGRRELIVNQLPPLACHPRIVELSTLRFQEALRNRSAVDQGETMLLFVARGSSYPEALAEMRRFASLRAEQTPVGRTEVCFAAIAEPDLPEGLRRAAASPFRRVVVQPHLLFTGQVLSQIERAVAKMAKLRPQREWIFTAHLGSSNLVATAVADLATAARRI